MLLLPSSHTSFICSEELAQCPPIHVKPLELFLLTGEAEGVKETLPVLLSVELKSRGTHSAAEQPDLAHSQEGMLALRA